MYASTYKCLYVLNCFMALETILALSGTNSHCYTGALEQSLERHPHSVALKGVAEPK